MRQWLRVCKLKVGDGKQTIDLSEMRIRFSIEMSDGRVPNTADIWVTNLSDHTANLIRREYTKVTLEAGYREGYGLIFDGEIVQGRVGRENPTDTYLNIIARDSDRAYNHSVVSKTLEAGHTYLDQVKTALEPMKAFGVRVGQIADLGSKKMPSARVLFGMSRDILDAVAVSTNTSWSIQNGEFQMVKNNEPRKGGIIVLNSDTGLIGMPVQTNLGVEGRALIEPNLKIGSLIKIDQKSIQEATRSPLPTEQLQYLSVPPLAADGFYKLVWIKFIGDTRGQEWYADFVAVTAAQGGRISSDIAVRGIQLP